MSKRKTRGEANLTEGAVHGPGGYQTDRPAYHYHSELNTMELMLVVCEYCDSCDEHAVYISALLWAEYIIHALIQQSGLPLTWHRPCKAAGYSLITILSR